VTIQKEGSDWKVDMWPWGRNGKRIRRKFSTKMEAMRFEKHVLAEAAQGKEWNPSKGDNRKISQLIDVWYKGKGQSLKDGIRRKKCLHDIADLISNPIAKNIKPHHWLAYQESKRSKGISDKTLNNHLTYLNAVFNYLNDIEEIKYTNPLAKIGQIKIDEVELSWLTKEQIKHLIDTIEQFSQNPHVLLITKICLSTGARWGEAEGLKLQNVRNGVVTFNYTKGGRSRSIPLEDILYKQVEEHLTEWTSFTSSLSAFKRALNKSEIKLPKGQSSHVLRHSFASHFMMNGGNILALQRIMGHSSITVTMRYSHFCPEHFQDAIRLNPLVASRVDINCT
jgi:site-specific recombinase XerD